MLCQRCSQAVALAAAATAAPARAPGPAAPAPAADPNMLMLTDLEEVLDNAIPTTVKSFELNGQELDGQSISLTVGGMAGLPVYEDAEVNLKDSDEAIERRLRGDLDYRVGSIQVDGDGGDGEQVLNLNIGQLERLLENGIEISEDTQIKLDPSDTLVVNVAGARELMEINFSGNIVIEDDGNKIRSLFDGYWNVPDGVDINVQLRSLDNAPLPLSVWRLVCELLFPHVRV